MDWDDREDKLDEQAGQNKIRHSMECPQCRSRTSTYKKKKQELGHF